MRNPPASSRRVPTCAATAVAILVSSAKITTQATVTAAAARAKSNVAIPVRAPVRHPAAQFAEMDCSGDMQSLLCVPPARRELLSGLMSLVMMEIYATVMDAPPRVDWRPGLSVPESPVAALCAGMDASKFQSSAMMETREIWMAATPNANGRVAGNARVHRASARAHAVMD